MSELSVDRRWIAAAPLAALVLLVVANWPRSMPADEVAAKQSCQDFIALDAGAPANAPADWNVKLVTDGVQQAKTAAAENSVRWQQLYTFWFAVENAHDNPTELAVGQEGIRNACSAAGYK